MTDKQQTLVEEPNWTDPEDLRRYMLELYRASNHHTRAREETGGKQS